MYRLNKQETDSDYRILTKQVYEHLTVMMRNGVTKI